MEKAYEPEILMLLHTCRIGSLATTGEHGPEASMAPYVIDQGDIILHISELARHTGNISNHPQAGLMICMPETTADSPLGLPRLSLQGSMVSVSDDQYDRVKSVYLHTIPDAEPLFEFSDFRLFRLIPTCIYWVGGFASARTISLKEWHQLTVNREEQS